MAAEVKPNVFARFGNDLHSGAGLIFIGKRRPLALNLRFWLNWPVICCQYRLVSGGI